MLAWRADLLSSVGLCRRGEGGEGDATSRRLVRAHPPTCQQVSYCVEEVIKKLVSILLL